MFTNNYNYQKTKNSILTVDSAFKIKKRNLTLKRQSKSYHIDLFQQNISVIKIITYKDESLPNT